MKVAVMMAAYNAERHIAEALGSLLAQRNAAQLDIIVIDDGSTDGTAAILDRIAAEAPEVRLIRRENRGIVRTRNDMLAAITPDTDLVTTLDADDLSPAGRLARDVRHFVEDPALEMHFGAMRFFAGSPDDGDVMDLRGIQLGAVLLRRRLQQRIGEFDAEFEQGEDTDYLLRAGELQAKLMLVDDLCVYYRRHGGNVTKDHGKMRRGLARAMMKSLHRRKQSGGAALPPGFFDGNIAERLPSWW